MFGKVSLLLSFTFQRSRIQHWTSMHIIFHFSMIVCVPQVKNDIASAIFRRVIKVFKAFVNVHTHTHNSLAHSSFYEQNLQAHKSGETFRVFILMPLLPAFEGDVSGDSGTGREEWLRPNV